MPVFTEAPLEVKNNILSRTDTSLLAVRDFLVALKMPSASLKGTFLDKKEKIFERNV